MSEPYFKRLLKSLSHKSRTKKFDLLLSLFRPQPEDRVLDIGASGKVFLRYTLEDIYPYSERIVGGGYDLHEVQSARQYYPRACYAAFDGCALPFPDKSFDLVFSNAVIEHILGEGRQQLFAQEVMRVGKSWFVTTPNYWYPFESHYHLPFIQFLPRELQRHYNRLLGTHIPRGQVQELALLSARGLQRLFPTGRIARVRVTFWPETLVAYFIDPSRCERNERGSDRGLTTDRGVT
ncbi:MAG TPA: methyltransferase domain-containing protein [Terriglobia bacterium]|nr:methyltransferase domain-containing protein [Terriglobia bacterium]